MASILNNLSFKFKQLLNIFYSSLVQLWYWFSYSSNQRYRQVPDFKGDLMKISKPKGIYQLENGYWAYRYSVKINGKTYSSNGCFLIVRIFTG